MTGPNRSFPPPEDAAARYDAVLRRGRSLRRRQRLVRGAGAGGAAIAVVAVAVAVSVGGASNNPVVIDQAGTTTTSITATTAGTPAAMSVTVMADSRAVAVRISDPAQAAAPTARICAQVRLALQGAAQVAAAEGSACWTPAVDGSVDTTGDLRPTNGAEVGCATSQTREGAGTQSRGDPATTTPATTTPVATTPATRSVRHDFSFPVPAGLPAGKYVAEVTGVSGLGDGCPPSTDGEAETVATGKATLRLP